MSFLEDLPAEDQGILCACQIEECLCQDTADFRWRGEALCGCCLGDCPDVHPERAVALWRKLSDGMAAATASKEMVSEGGPLGEEDLAAPIRFRIRRRE